MSADRQCSRCHTEVIRGHICWGPEDGSETSVLLTCKTCGHWAKGPLPKSRILDWLRVHKCAGVESAPGLVQVRESSCENPCLGGG